jgi:hypothetical protein
MTPFIAKLIERSCVTTHANCSLDDLITILAKRRTIDRTCHLTQSFQDHRFAA